MSCSMGWFILACSAVLHRMSYKIVQVQKRRVALGAKYEPIIKQTERLILSYN